MELFKCCTRCKETKNLSDYSPDKKARDSHESICRKCYRELNKQWRLANPERNKQKNKQFFIDHPGYSKSYSKSIASRTIIFKGKKTRVESPPRTGQCSKCGKRVGIDSIKITYMHHDNYDENNPLKNTRELCAGCHRQEHARIRKEGWDGRCLECRSQSTYVTRNGPRWHFKDSGIICGRCYVSAYWQKNKKRICTYQRNYSRKMREQKRVKNLERQAS